MISADDLDPAIRIPDPDRSGVRQIVAVDASKECGLSRTGRTGEHEAFAGRCVERRPRQNLEHDPAAIVELEALVEVPHDQQR
jgi:hypothetical protein